MKSLRVSDVQYATHRERVDSWLGKKGLLGDGVYRLVRVGPWALALRFTDPPRLSRMSTIGLPKDRAGHYWRGRDEQRIVTAARRFPRLVLGWPL